MALVSFRYLMYKICLIPQSIHVVGLTSYRGKKRQSYLNTGRQPGISRQNVIGTVRWETDLRVVLSSKIKFDVRILKIMNYVTSYWCSIKLHLWTKHHDNRLSDQFRIVPSITYRGRMVSHSTPSVQQDSSCNTKVHSARCLDYGNSSLRCCRDTSCVHEDAENPTADKCCPRVFLIFDLCIRYPVLCGCNLW